MILPVHHQHCRLALLSLDLQQQHARIISIKKQTVLPLHALASGGKLADFATKRARKKLGRFTSVTPMYVPCVADTLHKTFNNAV